ncbi:MAG: hypothetical protein HY663_04115 [Chloroflexi bacterium]|nr:hypothetical protein [Chloroflexota bacterium]
MATRVGTDLEKYKDIKKLREEIEKKTGKTPEQLYEEREKRLRDATELKEPDRVPFGFSPSTFSLHYVGLPLSAEYYEPDLARLASIKTLLDFEPDCCRGVTTGRSGLALESLEPKHEHWPGGNLPSDVPHQVVLTETMKAEEYDLFITDPLDFILRYYLPRTFAAMGPLSKLPRSIESYTGVLGMTALFTTPEFQKMAQALLYAGQEEEKLRKQGDFTADLGFPPFYYPGGVCNAVAAIPFDWIGDLRGANALMIDIYKRPEKVLAACARVFEWHLARALPADPTRRGHPRRARGGVTYFCGSSFLSKKQFETFVWPTWKMTLLATIDLGFVPWIRLSGKFDDRWEYFLELPKTKFILNFQEGDMARAKAMFGNHCCIQGNLPYGLLETGSPQEVEEQCKNLIRVCGKGGGYILDASTESSDANPANVRAMANSVNKYGRY